MEVAICFACWCVLLLFVLCAAEFFGVACACAVVAHRVATLLTAQFRSFRSIDCNMKLLCFCQRTDGEPSY